jgi:deoxyribodipyrimidine photo-lyase
LSNESIGVVIFTRDLRLRDHPALTDAIARCESVVPAFVFDDEIIERRDVGANRWQFLLDSLQDLDRSLRVAGAALVVRRGRWVAEVIRLAIDVGAVSVFVSDDRSALAVRRMAALRGAAAQQGIAVSVHPGVTVVPPGELRTRSGDDYKVFTPYHRSWLAATWRAPVPAPVRVPARRVDPGALPELHELTSAQPSPSSARGGEERARAALKTWTSSLASYADRHNQLGADDGFGATSRISAAFHFGCLSPLEVATRLRSRKGGAPFLRQLCWRDFFHQVLAADPSRAWSDVRPRGDAWEQDDDAFAAWTEGRTGYPIVDAGMRQLRIEGFMHNRARMIVASFVTKDLYVDWRRGAAHFMSWLTDGDVACNQLNWQWVAGTGNDPNAYRVFNPTLQGRRFDPSGAYTRRYVAELGDVATDDIHDPPPLVRASTGYPSPIVDHRDAIARFRLARAERRA